MNGDPAKTLMRPLYVSIVCICCVLISASTLTSCYHFNSNTASADVLSASNVQNIVRLDSSVLNFGLLRNAATVYAFYSSHQFIPVWIKNSKPSPLADSLIDFIKMSRTYGLLRNHYRFDELSHLIPDSVFNDDRKVREFDMLLTDAFLSISNDLKSGRSFDDSVSLHQSKAAIDSVGLHLLNTSLQKSELRKYLEGQEPQSFQYKKMQAVLRDLIFSTDSVNRQFYVQGKADTSALSEKIMTIEINMDRWRKDRLNSSRNIFVNIPAYTLEVYQGDTLALESKIIVGTRKNQTPALDGLIRSFTIFPYWNVPRSIAVKEILPQIKNDSTYLESHNYEILDIDGNIQDAKLINWEAHHTNNFPFIIRQKQGLYNSLGLIKFSFHNPYSVYLHDTNARLLFNKEKRSLSHGCVRVEKALELGRLLLLDNEICSPEDLDQYLELKKQMVIRILEPIPVHIRYYTCAYRNGVMEYYEDVYGEDKVKRESVYGLKDEPLM